MSIGETISWCGVGSLLVVVILALDLMISGGLAWERVSQTHFLELRDDVFAAAIGIFLTLAAAMLVHRWSPAMSKWATRIWAVAGTLGSFSAVFIWFNRAHEAYGVSTEVGSRLTAVFAILGPVLSFGSFLYLILHALIERRARPGLRGR